jgi:hypothetical protein
MVMNVYFRMTKNHPVTLAIVGWLVFFVGVIVDSTFLKLILLSAARVLP